MSETPLYNDIAQGLKEAIAYERGELDARSVRLVRSFPKPPEWTPDEIKSLRLRIPLTQNAFASLMGVSIKTVEAWESGRNHPNGCASRLMQVLAKDSASAGMYHGAASLIKSLNDRI